MAAFLLAGGPADIRGFGSTSSVTVSPSPRPLLRAVRAQRVKLSLETVAPSRLMLLGLSVAPTTEHALHWACLALAVAGAHAVCEGTPVSERERALDDTLLFIRAALRATAGSVAEAALDSWVDTADAASALGAQSPDENDVAWVAAIACGAAGGARRMFIAADEGRSVLASAALALKMAANRCATAASTLAADASSPPSALISSARALIELPPRYDDLLVAVGRAIRGCPGGKRHTEAALCLVCGVLVCAGAACCRDSPRDPRLFLGVGGHAGVALQPSLSSMPPAIRGRPGAATLHAVRCGGGTGIFLHVNSSRILLVSGLNAAWSHSPYADIHGESDHMLKRGKPLTLFRERYAGLCELWASAGVAKSVAAERAVLDSVIQPGYY